MLSFGFPLLLCACIAGSRSERGGETGQTRKDAVPSQPGANLQPLFDDFNEPDNGRWSISDGYSNGPLFHCGWRKDNVTFENGNLRLRLTDAGCPDTCAGKPYAAGEYATTNKYGYGRYEARMKPAKLSGVMSGSLFTYNGNPQDEIDIEFLGRDTTILQTNYFTNGVGQHETDVKLGFDASEAFHNYAFEWRPDSITWFVDDKQVHREDGSRGPLPRAAGALIVNIWPGHTLESWLGALEYQGKPVFAEYEWIRFTPLR